MVILLLVFLLLNGFAIQAFEVFTYDVHWSDSIAPSYASLSRDVNLPESFILCTSSKEATFNDVGMYSIYGEDSTSVDDNEYPPWLTSSHVDNRLGRVNSQLGRNSKSSARLLVSYLSEN